MSENKAFSIKLKEYLKKHNLTIKAGADYLGVPLRTFENWIYDKRKPAIYTQKIIEQALDNYKKNS